MGNLNHIRNYLQIDDRLATGGMPDREDFATIRQAGFKVVINLALATSDSAIPDEGALVSAQGMTYVHIPVEFNSPQTTDFERFARIMDACSGDRVFVHCVANLRVSAFIFLYRLHHGANRAEAERDWKRMGEPDDVWREFVNQRLAKLVQAPLRPAST